MSLRNIVSVLVVLKKVLSCLPKYVAILYYNAFIRSYFSYCVMFWFHNDRSGRCKLIEKIEYVINRLAYNNKQSVHDFIVSSQICDLWKSLTLHFILYV